MSERDCLLKDYFRQPTSCHESRHRRSAYTRRSRCTTGTTESPCLHGTGGARVKPGFAAEEALRYGESRVNVLVPSACPSPPAEGRDGSRRAAAARAGARAGAESGQEGRVARLVLVERLGGGRRGTNRSGGNRRAVAHSRGSSCAGRIELERGRDVRGRAVELEDGTTPRAC